MEKENEKSPKDQFIPLPPTIITEKHDGIVLGKTYQGLSMQSFDIGEALNQSNPRNVFLNGQLFVEMQCDTLISIYYTNNRFGLSLSSMINFLKSRNCDFNTKIYLLKLMLKDDRKSRKAVPIIDGKIISSLEIMGRIRNAYHHNLAYRDAFYQASKEGAKFPLINKKLETSRDTKGLVDDFKKEVIELYNKLHDLIHEIGTI